MYQGCAFNRARKAKSLSITDIATEMGVTRAAVSNWDKGKSYPRREMARRLADLLEINADDLQREPVSHYAASSQHAESIADIFADARRRLSAIIDTPTHRIKLTFSIDG